MKLQRGVQRTAPQNSTIDLDGVPLALASSGTYGGITIQNNASTGFVWECNGGNGPITMANANTAVGSASANNLSLPGMQYVYGQASFGNEEPTLIITTQTGWGSYWNLLVSNQRYIAGEGDIETTRAGFRNLMFNRAVVLHDQFVPSGQMQMFTEKYVRPLFHPNSHFTMDPFMMPSNQDIAVARIKVVVQIQFLQLRPHSLLTTIANA